MIINWDKEKSSKNRIKKLPLQTQSLLIVCSLIYMLITCRCHVTFSFQMIPVELSQLKLFQNFFCFKRHSDLTLFCLMRLARRLDWVVLRLTWHVASRSSAHLKLRGGALSILPEPFDIVEHSQCKREPGNLPSFLAFDEFVGNASSPLCSVPLGIPLLRTKVERDLLSLSFAYIYFPLFLCSVSFAQNGDLSCFCLISLLLNCL